METFLGDQLRAPLRGAKIVAGATERAYFLGHYIHCPQCPEGAEAQMGRRCATRLDVPIDRLISKLKHKGCCSLRGHPTLRGRATHEPIVEIILSYRRAQARLLNFYSMANNCGVSLRHRIHYILKYSCALTIASKMKLSTLKKVFKRCGSAFLWKPSRHSIWTRSGRP